MSKCSLMIRAGERNTNTLVHLNSPEIDSHAKKKTWSGETRIVMGRERELTRPDIL